MGSRRRDRRAGRLTPRPEPLESRDLPAVSLAHRGAAMVRAPAFPAVVRLGVTNVPQGIPGTATAPPANAAGGLPVSHEVARQRYVARMKGGYLIGPGRYTDQALQLSSKGYGGSNQDLHLLSNMRIVVPADPNADATGAVYLIPWNTSTTGTQLILDLKGDRTSDVLGVPTHYTWTVDPASAGLYTNAAGYGSGQGTLDLTFFRPGKGPRPGVFSGQLQYAINGFIDTGGIFSDIGVLGNIAKSP